MWKEKKKTRFIWWKIGLSGSKKEKEKKKREKIRVREREMKRKEGKKEENERKANIYFPFLPLLSLLSTPIPLLPGLFTVQSCEMMLQYSLHRRTVVDMALREGGTEIISCDGAVHVGGEESERNKGGKRIYLLECVRVQLDIIQLLDKRGLF